MASQKVNEGGRWFRHSPEVALNPHFSPAYQIRSIVMTISIRDFTRKIYDHLKEGEYVVTKNGTPIFVVTIRPVSGVIPQETVMTRQDVVTKAKAEYGCGCARVEGKPLCPKHGRY